MKGGVAFIINFHAALIHPNFFNQDPFPGIGKPHIKCL
jgi:hypothetical protein